MKIPYPTAEEARNRAHWYYDNTQHIVDKHFNKILKKIKKISIKGGYELRYKPLFPIKDIHSKEIATKLLRMGYRTYRYGGRDEKVTEEIKILWGVQ